MANIINSTDPGLDWEWAIPQHGQGAGTRYSWLDPGSMEKHALISPGMWKDFVD